MPDNGLIRVDFDDLDVDLGGTQYLWQGQPFTGIAYETRPDGSLISEGEYRHGFNRGFYREWYGSERLREEMHFGNRGLHGPAREWHTDGRLKSEVIYEDGIALSKKEWDEQGKLTLDWYLSETDPGYTDLQEWRRLRTQAQATQTDLSATETSA